MEFSYIEWLCVKSCIETLGISITWPQCKNRLTFRPCVSVSVHLHTFSLWFEISRASRSLVGSGLLSCVAHTRVSSLGVFSGHFHASSSLTTCSNEHGQPQTDIVCLEFFLLSFSLLCRDKLWSWYSLQCFVTKKGLLCPGSVYLTYFKRRVNEYENYL